MKTSEFGCKSIVAHELRPNVKTLFFFPFHVDLGFTITNYDYRKIKILIFIIVIHLETKIRKTIFHLDKKKIYIYFKQILVITRFVCSQNYKA